MESGLFLPITSVPAMLQPVAGEGSQGRGWAPWPRDTWALPRNGAKARLG